MMLITPGKHYTNLKSGNFYQVLHIAVCSETLGDLIVYQRVDVDGFSLGLPVGSLIGTIWVRPADLFRSKFKEY